MSQQGKGWVADLESCGAIHKPGFSITFLGAPGSDYFEAVPEASLIQPHLTILSLLREGGELYQACCAERKPGPTHSARAKHGKPPVVITRKRSRVRVVSDAG